MPKTKETAEGYRPDRRRIKTFRRTLLRWYQANKREFIWREEYPDPYVVLVSEFMLQQTQTSRVQQLLPLFLERFPSLHDLAQANNAQMIIAWRGLGYNSRALRLRDCARAIVEQHAGAFPQSEELLRALPGIGPYTAAALCVFAFHQAVIVIDVNVERVIQRVFADELVLSERATERRGQFYALLHKLQDSQHISQFYQALMDVGAQICKARTVDCASCPLQHLCSSAHHVEFATKVKRAEPAHRGEPNRIWRGRCVEQLRNSSKHQSSMPALLRALIPDTEVQDTEWFEGIIKALERDGIVERNARRIRLAE